MQERGVLAAGRYGTGKGNDRTHPAGRSLLIEAWNASTSLTDPSIKSLAMRVAGG